MEHHKSRENRVPEPPVPVFPGNHPLTEMTPFHPNHAQSGSARLRLHPPIRTSRTAASRRALHAASLALLASLPAAAQADDVTRFVEPDIFENVWSRAMLYKDDLNPVIEEFKLRGLYQGYYWDVHNDIPGKADRSNSAWENRRVRFGFDAKLADKKIELRSEFQTGNEIENGYNGLVDSYIRWRPDDSLFVTLGKQKPNIAANDWMLAATDTLTTCVAVPAALAAVKVNVRAPTSPSGGV